MSSETPRSKRPCGRVHEEYRISQAGVQYVGCSRCNTITTAQFEASAAYIGPKAAEYREEAECRMAAYRLATHPVRQARHLAEAHRSYQLAYELEN